MRTGRIGPTVTAVFLALACGGSAGAQVVEAGAGVAQRTTAASEPVRIPVDGAVLAGTLLIPSAAAPHPAVVLVPGARESRFLPGVAEHLAANGIAVLDLAKRGVDGSTGRWDRQSFEGRAADIVAAIAFLGSRRDIDAARIGLVGHSQGGWIVQMVAAQRPDVAFLVLLAAPAQTVRDQILTYERIQHERRGVPPARVDRKVASLQRQLAIARSAGPVCRALRAHYVCHIIGLDPASRLERITVPVLALYGEVDPMVPPELNVPLLCAAFGRSGHADVTIRVLPRANHDFLEATTGLPEEYHGLRRTHVDGFLPMIQEWIAAQVGRQADASREAPLRSGCPVAAGSPGLQPAGTAPVTDTDTDTRKQEEQQ
jgi:uncharacterized protein